MSQVDRMAGSLHTSKYAQTHICTFRKIPVGASQLPPPTACPDGARPIKNRRKERAKIQSVVLEVRWGHKKIVRLRQVCSEGYTGREGKVSSGNVRQVFKIHVKTF